MGCSGRFQAAEAVEKAFAGEQTRLDGTAERGILGQVPRRRVGGDGKEPAAQLRGVGGRADRKAVGKGPDAGGGGEQRIQLA